MPEGDMENENVKSKVNEANTTGYMLGETTSGPEATLVILVRSAINLIKAAV